MKSSNPKGKLSSRWSYSSRTGKTLGIALLSVLTSALAIEACGGKQYEQVAGDGPRDGAGGTGAAVGTGGDSESGTGGTESPGLTGGSGASLGGQGGAPEVPSYPDDLLGPPLIFNPTAESFGINVVLGTANQREVSAWIRPSTGVDPSDAVWTRLPSPQAPAQDALEWTASSLSAGSRYEYEIRSAGETVFRGSAVTQRGPGMEYKFAVITDTHVPPPDVVELGSLETSNYTEEVLLRVGANLNDQEPDFLVNLGDMLDFHEFGFNLPPPNGDETRRGYLNYRRLLYYGLGEMAHFPVIGNWDGENGDYTPEQIAYSRAQRLAYLPGPEPDTYPQGGNEAEDYYAYTWGDALFVVLNVMTYTPTSHLLSQYPGQVDDWTLGQEQLTWLETTLAQATSKWKFILIHHAVGGAAGDYENAAYGRGGGLAAMVGEQAIVHQMMLEYGVQVFFYGHDHVFTDIVVDDIHYTLPGSAGAPWKFDASETGYSEYWTDSGHAVVSVSPSSVEVEFLGMYKQVLHSYTIME